MSKGRKWMSQLKQRELIYPFSTFFVLFGTVNGLDADHPHWGGQSAYYVHFFKC